jgi:hypothetical protein
MIKITVIKFSTKHIYFRKIVLLLPTSFSQIFVEIEALLAQQAELPGDTFTPMVHTPLSRYPGLDLV